MIETFLIKNIIVKLRKLNSSDENKFAIKYMSYPYHRGNNSSSNYHNSNSNGSSSMYNRGSNGNNNNRIADEANVTLMELENNQRWVSC